MQTLDGPTNPRTWRVLKNRQVNSGSFTLHTVSPMWHLQVRSLYGFVLTGSPIVHIHFIRKFSEFLLHIISARSKDAGALGKKSNSSLVFHYLTIYFMLSLKKCKG